MVGCTGATVIQEGIFRIINAAGILLAAEWGYVLATTVEGGAERSGWWTPWRTHQLRPPFLIIRSMDGDRAPPLHSIVGVSTNVWIHVQSPRCCLSTAVHVGREVFTGRESVEFLSEGSIAEADASSPSSFIHSFISLARTERMQCFPELVGDDFCFTFRVKVISGRGDELGLCLVASGEASGKKKLRDTLVSVKPSPTGSASAVVSVRSQGAALWNCGRTRVGSGGRL
ncbi:hypothetical protein GW17_00001254 [Ensete ventricosum]|nr:hypothetical protein GW17_00001254 [Ensete ventricosum]RZS05844.1 hypothetical protein BHM03_00036409 [Ensete ventricosum]